MSVPSSSSAAPLDPCHLLLPWEPPLPSCPLSRCCCSVAHFSPHCSQSSYPMELGQAQFWWLWSSISAELCTEGHFTQPKRSDIPGQECPVYCLFPLLSSSQCFSTDFLGYTLVMPRNVSGCLTHRYDSMLVLSLWVGMLWDQNFLSWLKSTRNKHFNNTFVKLRKNEFLPLSYTFPPPPPNLCTEFEWAS